MSDVEYEQAVERVPDFVAPLDSSGKPAELIPADFKERVADTCQKAHELVNEILSKKPDLKLRLTRKGNTTVRIGGVDVRLYDKRYELTIPGENDFTAVFDFQSKDPMFDHGLGDPDEVKRYEEVLVTNGFYRFAIRRMKGMAQTTYTAEHVDRPGNGTPVTHTSGLSAITDFNKYLDAKLASTTSAK